MGFGVESRANHSGRAYGVPDGETGGARTRRIAMMKIEVNLAVVVVVVVVVWAADEHRSWEPCWFAGGKDARPAATERYSEHSGVGRMQDTMKRDA